MGVPAVRTIFRGSGFFLILAALFLVLSGCVEEGIWVVRGMDADLGASTGKIEIRRRQDGTFDFLRIAALADYPRDDGRNVELVWTGTGVSTGQFAWTFDVQLARIGFITAVGKTIRTSEDNQPFRVSCDVTVNRFGVLSSTCSSPDDPNFSVADAGVAKMLPADMPLWHSERERVKTHSEPDWLLKQVLFAPFGSYHDLPSVKPYTGMSDFKRAVHYQIRDMTDLLYYRDHPDRLRLVNKVLDEVSLAETEIRANAFRTALSDKAAFYQQGLSEEFVDAEGMVLRGINEAGFDDPDVDSALWTGIYMFTQGLRFDHTGDAEARENIRRSLRGLFTLMDITGDPATFARTLRPAGQPIAWKWERGQGEYAHLDWLSGGNNDMSKGLLIGFLTAWEILPADDPLQGDIRVHVGELLNLCIFSDPSAPGCDDGGSVAKDLPSTNPSTGRLLAGLVLGDPVLLQAGLDGLDSRALLELANTGGGPFYEYGTSDWSGNHLTLVSTIVLERLLAHTDDAQLKTVWARASAEAWKTLKKLDLPLQAAAAVVGGGLSSPDDLDHASGQTLEGLVSFPIPKHPYAVDHSMRDDFVLSPFPALPWKQDWESNPGRQQSLTAYPTIELGVDSYRWNDVHFTFRSAGLGKTRVPGVDYLFLYWLARDAGIIDATD